MQRSLARCVFSAVLVVVLKYRFQELALFDSVENPLKILLQMVKIKGVEIKIWIGLKVKLDVLKLFEMLSYVFLIVVFQDEVGVLIEINGVLGFEPRLGEICEQVLVFLRLLDLQLT